MKKKIPLGLRKVLESLAKKSNGIFDATVDGQAVLRFNDLDRSTNFFFEVEKLDIGPRGETKYVIGYLPCNYENLNSLRKSVKLPEIKGHFAKWMKLMVEVNAASPLFDDPILQSYYDELEPEFAITDEDARYKTYTISQQRRIVVFLDKAIEVVKSNSKGEERKEIVKEIEETKKTLSKSTKSEVVQRIRKFIARAFKAGLQVGEKLLVEFSAELAIKLINGN